MKSLKRAILVIGLSVMAFTLLFGQPQKGVINFSNAEVDLYKSIEKISGDVEFYWNRSYSPNDFENIEAIAEPQYFKIPKSWASYSINNEKLPSNGFATYRFWVDVKGKPEEQILGIRIPSIFTSYKIWINGEAVAEAGVVAKTKEEHVPKFLIDDIPFVVNGSENDVVRLEFVVQVSNYSHPRAGLARPMFIGSYNALKKSSRYLDILNLLVIGIVLVIGLNHINMYIFRRKDVSNLYFGMLTLVMILRYISTGDRIISSLFPQINWELLLKLDNFSGYCTIPFFVLFLYNQYKQDFPKTMKNLLFYLGAVFSIFIFATPASVYGKFSLVFELYLLLGGLYLTFGVLLIASFKKREGAFLSFLGMFLLYATTISDVLSSMELIQASYIAPYGLVAFMLLQSFIITSRSAKAINQNELLSYQLSLEKDSLEKNIEERTKELQKQHNTMVLHQEKEKIQQWINRGVTKINHVLSTNKNDFDALSRKVLTTLIKYMGVKLGALYIVNDGEEGRKLELVAQYGISKKDAETQSKMEIGDGLVGATFLDNELKIINNIPENYYNISSGLGSSKPKSILITPLSTDEAVLGVIELARFDEFKAEEVEFIKRIAFSIANNLNNTRMNDRNINLIKQFQEQTAEIQEKEEHIMESLQELEFYKENYEKLLLEVDTLKSANKNSKTE
ncbi:MAG: 7TM diverse intracellular signaling domain-containing protein [Bacteroidales bacterium]